MSAGSNHQSKTLLIVLGIVLLMATALGAYVLGMRKNESSTKYTQQVSPSTALQPTPTGTSAAILQLSTIWSLGTENYTNSKIDLSFQYPKSFSKNEVDSIKENTSFKQKYPEIKSVPYGDFFVSFYTPQAPIEERQKSNFDWTSYDQNSMSLGVDAYNNTQNTSLDDFLKIHYAGVGIDGKTPVYETLKKNLKPSSAPTTNSYVYVGSLGENPHKKVLFSYKDKFYIFNLQGGTGTGQQYSSDAEKIFDQVITSIKFL